MSGSAPMVGPPDGSFAEGAFAPQRSGVLESIDLAQSPTPRALRAYSQASSELGVLAQPEGGAPVLLPQEEKLSPDVLNQKYGIPGNLSFTDPLTEGSAASIYASHIDQIKQRDIEQRAPPGFVSGATRFGAQFAAGFLDPLQLGASMVPVVPEFELGSSVAAKIATAGARGAIAGTAGNLPLVGLQAAMSRSEYSDYTAYDALFDLAHGAALGAGIDILGAGGGAFGRALSQRYRASRAGPAAEADPGIAPSALKAGLAQIEQDNPVEVRPVYDQSNSPNVPEDYGAPSPLQETGTRGARAFLPENEPLGLTSFLQRDFTVGRPGDVNSERRAGGLKDTGGDLDAIIGGPKGRPGLINNESGSSLNEAANRAYEAGYFDHVPAENELLDAIAKDHNRTNSQDAIYSSRDQDQAEAYQYARDHNVEVDKMSAETGIPTEGQTPLQFWDQVADHLSLEESQAHIDRLGAEHDEAFEQAEQAARAWGGAQSTEPAGFTTALGSTYEVHEDGTTTRTKSLHPGHEATDVGRKAQSAKTIYVDPAVASNLSGAGVTEHGGKGFRLALRDGKAWLLSWNRDQDRWGVAPSAREIPYSEKPEVGRAPIEAWNKADDVPGFEAYSRQHAGNPITEVSHAAGHPSPEDIYRGAPHTLEEMEHEWHQAEAANPVLSGEGGGGQPGPTPADQGGVQGGAGQVPGAPGIAGRAGPEERSQTLQSALRDAAGRKPPDPTSLAAERSLKEGSPENLVKQAQQDIEDHTAFFQAAEAAGQLTEDVRAELEKIGNLDKEAADLTAAAKQAAACIARGAGSRA
jgi:hypothetical protein